MTFSKIIVYYLVYLANEIAEYGHCGMAVVVSYFIEQSALNIFRNSRYAWWVIG